MNLNQLDIIVSDVPQVCADLERILDKKSDYVDGSFAQFTICSHCLMLSQNHLIPLEDFQSGIILHIEVEDVDQNYQRLKEIGVEILRGPAVTDWGTESLLVKGPAGLVIDFYCMK
ncbi:VOC family protein [Streptococcus oralis]|uniref:VOC family protein n=1 Tax=Streptococcus oralis TaxID=1303 RepID=UPI00228457FB|nr:VOC family protein [Streptococcus oralis]MCY7081038.1 VOC family protein [Streptococcus oralis]